MSMGKVLIFLTGSRIVEGMTKKKLPPEVLAYFTKMGKQGGKLGGVARAEKMTQAERSESARKAVMARWDKQKKASG